MALILSLETSAASCSVALHQEGKLLKKLEINEPQAHAARLAVLINQLLEDSKLSARELDAVAVSAGPGSYTGLRIGTSTAKGICYALGLPLIAVNTLDTLAFQVTQNKQLKDVLLCPMIDAKRMEVYCQLMDEKLNTIQPVQAYVIEAASFSELLAGYNMFFFGDGAEKCKGIINHKNAFFVDGVRPNADTIGIMAFSKFIKGEREDLVHYSPFYLKEFIAKKARPVF